MLKDIVTNRDEIVKDKLKELSYPVSWLPLVDIYNKRVRHLVNERINEYGNRYLAKVKFVTVVHELPYTQIFNDKTCYEIMASLFAYLLMKGIIDQRGTLTGISKLNMVPFDKRRSVVVDNNLIPIFTSDKNILKEPSDPLDVIARYLFFFYPTCYKKQNSNSEEKTTAELNEEVGINIFTEEGEMPTTTMKDLKAFLTHRVS
jgi:hypothetical protein